jgi:phage shock protein PspC (stress-responsive transcriptional regulator)
MARRLSRSRRHRLIAGVCGGIAERLGWSPLWVRLLFVLGTLLPIFPGALVYLVLWLLVPDAAADAAPPRKGSRAVRPSGRPP